MNGRWNVLGMLGCVALVAGCTAAPTGEDVDSSGQPIAAATSAYTEHAKAAPLDNCRRTSAESWDCGEMQGYTFVARERSAAEGQELTIRTPIGEFDLDPAQAPDTEGGASHAFGYFAKLAEWRGRGLVSATPQDPFAGRVEPTALIARYFKGQSQADYGSFAGKNWLLVVKLGAEAVCLHSMVSGATPNHNQIARDIADSQAFKDHVCAPKTPRPNHPALSNQPCGTMPANTGIAQNLGLHSCDGGHFLAMQGDGNLVIYNTRNGRPTWASRTENTEGMGAFMRPNGQLVVYGKTWNPLFTAPETASDGATLVLQDDGNLVIYSTAGAPLWATRTNGK